MVKALVVDDERHVARLLQFILKKHGYQVFVAYDGIEAVEKIMQIRPDVVLLDLVLPRMSGLEVLDRIRSDPVSKDTKVLVLTGHAFDADSQGLSRDLADAFCTKPVAPSTLLARLKEIGAGPDNPELSSISSARDNLEEEN